MIWCESHGKTLWPLRKKIRGCTAFIGGHVAKWEQEPKRGIWKEEHDNSDMIVADQLCKKSEYYRELPELKFLHVDDEDP